MTITLELIILLASITFGIAIYWLEYQNNGFYRAMNKLTHSAETQMKPENKKGFIIQQSFVPRLIYVNVLFLILYVIAYFLLPFITLSVGIYTTTIVGTMIGIYIGQFLLGIKNTSEGVIDKAYDTGKDIVDKGKDILDTIITEEEPTPTSEPEPDTKKDGKSARERLKDKGYLK